MIGSPETIRRRLREFEATHVDQVILLNQAGRTTHEDICASLELFAREVMPEFHAREPEHAALEGGRARRPHRVSDDSTPTTYKLYAHQNEDIVRLTPEELKAEDGGQGGGEPLVSLRMRQICLVARELVPVVEGPRGVLGLPGVSRVRASGSTARERAVRDRPASSWRSSPR